MAVGRKPKTPEELIESFISRTISASCKNSSLGDCWIWQGAIFNNGYSQIHNRFGTRYGHQWACHHWNESPLPIAKGMCVKHKCDVKLCVNPDHLEYGTLQENIKEMIDRNPSSVNRIEPTNDQLELIKNMIKTSGSKNSLSKSIGKSRGWIDRVIKDYLAK